MSRVIGTRLSLGASIELLSLSRILVLVLVPVLALSTEVPWIHFTMLNLTPVNRGMPRNPAKVMSALQHKVQV